MKTKNQCVGLLLTTLLLLLGPPYYVAAQDNFFGNTGESFTPSTVIIIIMTVIFVLTAFLALILRQCSQGCFGLNTVPIDPNVTSDGRLVAHGLGTAKINSLPTYLYSDVKQHRKGKVELECSVCLTEFLESQVLRVLPGCGHVFHPACVDKWLVSHVTCPICRLNLEEEHAINVPPPPLTTHHQLVTCQDLDEEGKKKMKLGSKSGSDDDDDMEGKFSRGDDSSSLAADLERHTLILPEEVHKHNNLVMDHVSSNNCEEETTLTSMISPTTTSGTVDNGGSNTKTKKPSPVKRVEHLWPI